MITIVEADDWFGLYKDGSLVREGHSLDLEEVLTICDVNYKIKYADEDWLGELQTFPVDLDDVVFEVPF